MVELVSIARPVVPPLTPPPRCHLLEIPGELRNRIYRFLVVQDNPVLVLSGIQQQPITMTKKVGRGQVTWEKGNHDFHFNPPPQQPDLSRTCRTIRPEVLSIYYGEQTFKIGHRGTSYSSLSMGRFLQWRKCIGTWAVHIQSVSLTFDYMYKDYLGETPSYRVSARFGTAGELDLSILLVRVAKSGRVDSDKICPCYVKKLWKWTKRQGGSGKRLLELARAYIAWHTGGATTGVDCGVCGLEMESLFLV